MLKKVFLCFSVILGVHAAIGNEMTTPQTPEFLYKVTSLQDWEKSQPLGKVIVSKDDTPFIHLSTESQLERITGKYWSSVPAYVILKLATRKLQGRLVLEENPGGENKYYHLYEGIIPLNSVVDAKIVNK